MANCTKCGYRCRSKDKYCPQCGAMIQVPAKKNPGGPGNAPAGSGKQAFRANPLMLLVSLVIGTLLLWLVVTYFKLSPDMIDQYAKIISVKIVDEFVDPSYGFNSFLIGKIIVYTIIAAAVTTAYMLPMRITKVSLRAVGFSDRFSIVVATYFVVALGVFLYYWIVKKKMFNAFAHWISRAEGTQKLQEIGSLVLVIFLCLVCVAIIAGGSMILLSLFKCSIQVNGFLIGIFSAIYDILCSFFIVALVVGGVCFGIGAFFALFMMVSTMFSDGRRVVEIDGKYYYVE